MAVAKSSANDPKQVIQWIRIGASTLVVAIALSLIGMSSIGSWLAVVGMAVMTWNLHRLGRTGAS